MPVDIFAHIGFVVILLADSDKHRAVTLFGFLGNLVPGAASVHHKSQVDFFRASAASPSIGPAADTQDQSSNSASCLRIVPEAASIS